MKMIIFLALILSANLIYAEYEHCSQILKDGIYDTVKYHHDQLSESDLKTFLCNSEFDEKSSDTGFNAGFTYKSISGNLNYTKSNYDQWKKTHCESYNSHQKYVNNEQLFSKIASSERTQAWKDCVKSAEQGLSCSAKREHPGAKSFIINIKWDNILVGKIDKIKTIITNASHPILPRSFIKAGDNITTLSKISNLHEDSLIIFSGITAKTGRVATCTVFVPRVEAPAPIPDISPELKSFLKSNATKKRRAMQSCTCGGKNSASYSEVCSYCLKRVQSTSTYGKCKKVGNCASCRTAIDINVNSWPEYLRLIKK